MRLVLILVAGVLCVFLAHTAPLSFIILDIRGMQSNKLPEGWQLKVNSGTPDLAIVHEGRLNSLRLKSQKSSFGLERGLDIDVEQFPYLSWNWKVSQLPQGGDFRQSSTDDQAAQVLVAFSDRRVVSYLWDSSAPKGIMQSASWLPLVHIFGVVCRSGDAEANQWLSETRNVLEDYQKAYGRRPSRVKGIRLQINTQHTGTSAESYFGEVAFRGTPQ